MEKARILIVEDETIIAMDRSTSKSEFEQNLQPNTKEGEINLNYSHGLIL